MNQVLRQSNTNTPAENFRIGIAGLRGETERIFDAAGTGLEASLDELQNLSEEFRTLEKTLGDSEALGQSIDTVNTELSNLRSDIDGFGVASDGLHDAIRAILTEVRELDRVVRTMANISINARIQGNGLVPPRPQVTAFIERLGTMSSEAEEILGEINDAMSSAIFDVSKMEYEQKDMLLDLRRNVIPAITGYATISQRMRNSQDALMSASLELSTQMGQISSEVSRIIIAMQIGDSTRQRFERVEQTLSYCTGAKPDFSATLIDVSIALTEGAREDAIAEVDVAIGSLEGVGDSAHQALQAAAVSAFGQRSVWEIDHDENDLNTSLDASRKHFAVMAGQAQKINKRLDVILKHESTLRKIAHEVRLAGINAVIICAKLGEDGRALRELAQWLRDLTDESDAIIHRLQSILEKSRVRIHAVTEDHIKGLESSLGTFLTDATDLRTHMNQIGEVVLTTSDAFSVTAKKLPERIEETIANLSTFRTALNDLDAVEQPVHIYRAMLPPNPEVPAEGSADGAVLAKLRSRYTMEAERVLHDNVLGAERPAHVEDDDGLFDDFGDAPKASSGGGGDDLDDIMF